MKPRFGYICVPPPPPPHISTFAGNGSMYTQGGDGGPATSASLGQATCLTSDNQGNIYVGAQSPGSIRKINTSGIIESIAGNGSSVFGGDGGPATAASFHNIVALTTDTTGNIFVADSNRIRVIRSGYVETYVGNGSTGYSGDGGPAINATLGQLAHSISTDSAGNLYLQDSYNAVIRRVNSSGFIDTIAGNGSIAGELQVGSPATSIPINPAYAMATL